jgi:xylulokinase
MVVGGAGDCAAGAVGNGIVRSGLLSTSIGTSGVVFVHSESPQVDPEGRLHTFCHAVRGKWHMMGVTLSAGGSLQWFRNALCEQVAALAKRRKVDVYDVLTEEAAVTPPGAEGLFFLPYLAGERTPHADPHARGAFIGLTLKHSRGHLVRAIMEGVTYSLRDCLQIIEEQKVAVKQIRASGGGARSVLWRQMQADVLGKTVVSMAADEGPAYGVALLAAVGAGEFESVAEACDATVKTRRQTKPTAAARRQYDKAFPIYQQLYQSLRNDFRAIAESG